MHLAVLLFLTGVASAYPLKPVQESQLVPRDLPQPHCFRPVGTEKPVLIASKPMWMVNCAAKLGAVGFLKKNPIPLRAFRNSWENKEGEPPECVFPEGGDNFELGYCFVLKSIAHSLANTQRTLVPRPAQGDTAQPSPHPPSSHGPIHPNAAHPPANSPHSAAPQNSQHPPPQAPHRPASTNSSKDFPTATSKDSGLTYPFSGQQYPHRSASTNSSKDFPSATSKHSGVTYPFAG